MSATPSMKARGYTTGLYYWQPSTPPTLCNVTEPPSIVRPIVPVMFREHLGSVLQAENFQHGIEVGVREGIFAHALLSRWRGAKSYLLVDVWAQQKNYADTSNDGDQEQVMRNALARLRSFPVQTCRDFSVNCASKLQKGAYDFVYLDARHDYKGVLADLNAYWPLLRRGGIMAGHDYIWATEGGRNGRAKKGSSSNDYTINFDGSRDPFNRSVKGAVDEFFTRCVSRQVAVTYREGNRHVWDVFNTWYVRK